MDFRSLLGYQKIAVFFLSFLHMNAKMQKNAKKTGIKSPASVYLCFFTRGGWKVVIFLLMLFHTKMNGHMATFLRYHLLRQEGHY
jgi:hypothetical protein